MSDKKSAPEPSMEEILASIRRILAEDERGVPPAPPRSRGSADILDLTEAIGEDGTVRHIEPAAARRDAAAPPILPGGRVEPEPPRPNGADERLLSEPASAAVSASLARLAAAPRQPEPASEIALDDVVATSGDAAAGPMSICRCWSSGCPGRDRRPRACRALTVAQYFDKPIVRRGEPRQCSRGPRVAAP